MLNRDRKKLRYLTEQHRTLQSNTRYNQKGIKQRPAKINLYMTKDFAKINLPKKKNRELQKHCYKITKEGLD